MLASTGTAEKAVAKLLIECEEWDASWAESFYRGVSGVVPGGSQARNVWKVLQAHKLAAHAWRAKVICLAQDVRLCSKIATLYGHDLHDEGVRPAFTLWVWRQSTASKAVFRSAERIGLTRR